MRRQIGRFAATGVGSRRSTRSKIRSGTLTAQADPVSPPEKRERGARLRTLSRELEQRRWQTKLGRTDVVLVDRPGRGYGDDYTPFLVDAQVGQLVHVRAEAVTEEGILAVAA